MPLIGYRFLRGAGKGSKWARRKPLGVWVLFLGLFLSLFNLLVAAGVEAFSVKGAMELAAWGRFRIPHGGTWRTRLDLILEESLDETQLRVHGRLEARDGDRVSGDLREATVRLQTGDLHWVAGRQVVHWGSGILMNPTSLVNPLRWVDAEPERVPVDAVAIHWQSPPEWSGVLLWIPSFVPATDTLPDGTVVPRPDPVFDYSQWTLRADWRRGHQSVGFIASRGLERHPVKPGPGESAYRLGTTLGVDMVSRWGDWRLWVEGAYTAFDKSPKGETGLVVGVDRTSADGLYRAFEWHKQWDPVRGNQEYLMLLMEKDLGEAYRLSGSLIFDLYTSAFRLAPTFTVFLSEATEVALTVAYTDDRRGDLTLPLSNNEIRFRLTTRF